MSYNFGVFASSQHLPTLASLRVLVAASHPDLQFDEAVSLSDLDGFFPVTFDGHDAGFEVLIGPINDRHRNRYRHAVAAASEQPNADYLDALETSDVKFIFSCQTPAAIDAARIFATELARATGGYFSDPQLGILHRVERGNGGDDVL